MQWDREIHDGKVTVRLTSDELRILNNSMNEALERVNDRVFPTLMGADREEVAALLGEFRSLRSQVGSRIGMEE